MDGRPPMVGPVGVDVRCVLARPKRLTRKADADGLLWAPKRPDVDNLVKTVLDGCAAAWGDDAQVVRLTATKVYAERDGAARTDVVIYALGARGPL